MVKITTGDKLQVLVGAILSADTAPAVDAGIANKKYVDDGANKVTDGSVVTGYRYCSVNDGAVQQVFTKYFTGTTDADSTTNVAHGVTAANILHVSAIIFHSGTNYFVYDMQMSVSLNDAFTLVYDATNIILGNVGTNNQSRAYKIKIEYTI